MAKKTIRDISVDGKRVLARFDLNVPLQGNRITDDRRITAAMPTLKHLLDEGGRVVAMSHLGRPTGDPEKDKVFTLQPVAKRLTELLGFEVPLIGSYRDGAAMGSVDSLPKGSCCLLENLRFHEAETIKDKDAAKDSARRVQKDAFARDLADLGDVYVNDAFGTCHRDNASMLTLPKIMEGRPRVLGLLVERELKFLGEAVTNPQHPFVVILGGAKVSDKIGVIEALKAKCDHVLIGGAMMFTFWGAAGLSVGKSLCERELFEEALRLRSAKGGMLHVPIDAVCGEALEEGVETKVSENGVPDAMMGLDIGPKTLESFKFILSTAKTIVWNGPMGAFETKPFDRGTMAIAECMADATDRGAVTIIGGGDSAAAVDEAGVADRLTHISTGGGASLEFLEGRSFAALDVIDER